DRQDGRRSLRREQGAINSKTDCAGRGRAGLADRPKTGLKVEAFTPPQEIIGAVACANSGAESRRIIPAPLPPIFGLMMTGNPISSAAEIASIAQFTIRERGVASPSECRSASCAAFEISNEKALQPLMTRVPILSRCAR